MPRERRIGILYLAFANIRAKSPRSAGLALMVAVSAFVMLGGALLSGNVDRGMDSLARRLGADLMVVPQGYDSRMQTVLLRGEPSSFYLDEAVVDEIRALDGVAQAVPQLYLATLEDACCAYPIQIIGFDTDADFVVAPWMETNSVRKLEADSIVAGHLIASPVNAKTFFFGAPFTVSARLARTGMGFDTSMFMPLDRARQLLRESDRLAGIPERSVSSVLVKLHSSSAAGRIAGKIRRGFGGKYALDVIVAQDMVTGLSARIDGLLLPLRALAVVLWIGSVCVLFLFFSVLTGERRRELALLRVLGAARRDVNRLVLLESLLLGGVGTAAGIGAALLIVLPFQTLIFTHLGLPYLALTPAETAGLALPPLAAGLATGPLACLYAVLRESRREIYPACGQQ